MRKGSTPGKRVERSGAVASRGMQLSVIQGFLKLNALAECTAPRQGESYYLRLLLHEVKGPQKLDVKRVSDTLCQTFHEACKRRGLMDDDNHHKMALGEAASCHSPCALRSRFAMILIGCEPANPLSLWLLHLDRMTEDILNSQELSNNGIQVTDHMYNQCLCQIQDRSSSWVAKNVICMDCQCQTQAQSPNASGIF